MNNFVSKSETVIKASPDKVWEALINPELVKHWLFGTEMSVTTWQVGGRISYKGEWEGKFYEDKGEILEIIPGKKLVSSYWSGFSGLPDSPENYQKVSYELSAVSDGTRLAIVQEGNKSEESAKHSENNWNKVLESMKQMLEK